ncbi:MAG TPA: hypothetical protein VKZ86_07895 [Cyclobacteriaceae bacterium]|nr:hypothetical protein [Cyclobacteriaceae bacterium]
MKKTIVLTALLAACFCHLQAQPEDRIPTTLATRFAADFPHADSPRWTRDVSGVALASFQSNGEVMVAYYDAREHRIATARKVAQPQLPLLVRNALDESVNKLGSDTRMGPIFELVIASATHYIVSVEGREKTCTFKFDPTGNRTVMHKRASTRPGAAAPQPYLARQPKR